MQSTKLKCAIVLFCVALMPAMPNAQAKPAGNVTYRPAPPATIRYPDGTVVVRHADGSVEVSDGDSYRTAPASTARPRSHAVKKKTSAAKKHH